MPMKELIRMLGESKNIVFFGGAGTSTESGIPDFRSASGLYKEQEKNNYPPEVILSYDFFMSHTEKFYDFYKKKMIYRDAKPNAAHIALVELEKNGKLAAVITQNIDGLHQMTGSGNVLELHGSIHRNFCTRCRKSFGLDYVLEHDGVPHCDECGNVIKPDVVLYGEHLDDTVVTTSINHIAGADMLIVAGTSLEVYPAASLIDYFAGNHLVLINKTPTQSDWKADLVLYESVGKVLSKAVGTVNQKPAING